MNIPIVGEDRPNKGTVTLDAESVRRLALFHEVAQKYDLGLFCPKCLTAIQGVNSGQEREFVVICGCTEFRGPNPGRRVVAPSDSRYN